MAYISGRSDAKIIARTRYGVIVVSMYSFHTGDIWCALLMAPGIQRAQQLCDCGG